VLPGQADQQRERLLVRAAGLGEEDEVGGVYLGDCKITAVTDPDAADALKHGVHPHAADPSAAARQWEISAALTGIDVFARSDGARANLALAHFA
jgi:hypothetical protein